MLEEESSSSYSLSPGNLTNIPLGGNIVPANLHNWIYPSREAAVLWLGERVPIACLSYLYLFGFMLLASNREGGG